MTVAAISPSADPLERALITPEGVKLRVKLASASERAGALIIDLVIIVVSMIALTLLTVSVLIAGGVDQLTANEAPQIIWLLGFFVIRNFYFTGFECGARAATPGKRIMKLRVAARDGGALRVERIVARNAMRELELYLPIGFLLQGAQDIGAVLVLLGILWCAIFVFFPLFNRDRLRLGDIIAGTWVLKAPKQTLLPDIAEAAAADTKTFVFTDRQLDQYGVKELQVLETVLRNFDATVMEAVAQRIRAKIEWRRPPNELDSEFLRAYYTQLRRRLEQKLLFGKRKADKHDRS